MKKILTYIGISLLLITSSYATLQEVAEQRLLEDSGNWKKTTEEPSTQKFTCINHPEESVTISLEQRASDPYLMKQYSEKPTDVMSLLEHEEFSALQRMKELRIESKKTSSPYEVWKLLYVFNDNDIIYEYTVPPIGPYHPCYTMTRLIKTDRGYLKIAYHSSIQIDKATSVHWLQWLKELS